ncbi:MAG: hypothetical protein ABI354_02075 [Candidatus Saccharimonadales bacterium]
MEKDNMAEFSIHPELLTLPEADRRLAVANSLVQLDIVSQAFTDGQIQPYMIDFRVLHDYLPGRKAGYIVSPNAKIGGTCLMGSFASGLNYSIGFGSVKLGYEIDFMEPEMTFKVGPEFQPSEMVNIHDPNFPSYKEDRSAALRDTYSVDDFREEELPLGRTATFIRLADLTYRYAARHIINPRKR